MIYIPYIAIILFSYLLGSIPFGFLIGKLKGVDIRTLGSGNIGTTNVFRNLGKKAGFTTFFLDGLKGFLALTISVMIIDRFAATLLFEHWGEDMFPKMLSAVSVVLGHNYTLFLRFKGGKGVATSAGVAFGLNVPLILLALSVFFMIVLTTKYVSLGAIVGIFSAIIFSLLLELPTPIVIFSTIAFVVAVLRHKENIKRLLKGTERKSDILKGLKKKKTS